MRVPAMARMRSAVVRMPMRLSGSAALMTMRRPSARRAADLAQSLDGFGERELFAGHAGDEAAAADFAARFEAAVDAGQLAPRSGVRFAREEAAEDDAVASQQRAGLRLDGFFAVDVARSGSDQRPARSGRRPMKPSRGDEAGVDELVERFRVVAEVAGEGGAARAERCRARVARVRSASASSRSATRRCARAGRARRRW